MATLEHLKQSLKEIIDERTKVSSAKLSDEEYSNAFEIFVREPAWSTYRDFVIPQLSQLMESYASREGISVLEIGPGPRSVLGHLPLNLSRKIRKYTAFEPNGLFAKRLEEWIRYDSPVHSQMRGLKNPPAIHRANFPIEKDVDTGTNIDISTERFDMILFCHSLYGMKSKQRAIEQALRLLKNDTPEAAVVVFHRERPLQLGGLLCYQTASFPTGVVHVTDNDEELDLFASFMLGLSLKGGNVAESIRDRIRQICRSLGRRIAAEPSYLLFSSPNLILTFNRHADALPKLTEQVPLVENGWQMIKNREARSRWSTPIVRPNSIGQVQQCVKWALRHNLRLTVTGGGHSGHCLWHNTVSIDMSAFDKIHILEASGEEMKSGLIRDDSTELGSAASIAIVESGCKTGDIVRKTMDFGLTVPLGARPSVGAGSWLQGGISHLSRLHGLACDSVVGAVIVSVESGEVFCVGNVPLQYQPPGAVRPKNEFDMLWAIKGAGSNFGVVISVTLKTIPAPTYFVRNWVVALDDNIKVHEWLGHFNFHIARYVPRNCPADAYLYSEANQLHLGITISEFSSTHSEPSWLNTFELPTTLARDVVPGTGIDIKTVDGTGMFDCEMYMSGIHGGHASGKTSSFKRCFFLDSIVADDGVVHKLCAAMEARPSPLCYIHFLQAGGAVRDVPVENSAFGFRNWEFACVITGVWPRDQDGTELSQLTISWVYDVVYKLLPKYGGVYGADLGPDPRDAGLAMKAFGRNLSRLSCLKEKLDPNHVLSHACPLRKKTTKLRLIILVTGESCSGKDFCAGVWAAAMGGWSPHFSAYVASISDSTKQAYAAATGVNLFELLHKRKFKEKHRQELTKFFQEQVRQQPSLPQQHFQSIAFNAEDWVDVLFITGMRDKAPVKAMSHLVRDVNMIEIRVQASEKTRQLRRASESDHIEDERSILRIEEEFRKLSEIHSDDDHQPDFVFENNKTGTKAVKGFAEDHLFPMLDKDLQTLASMVHAQLNFPRVGIKFRHVLGICQQPGGLSLSTDLLRSHFTGDWSQIEALVCCDAGGHVFASPLAMKLGIPLVLVRDAGKLPPPTVSVAKRPSYIASAASNGSQSEDRIEMEQWAIPAGALVVVVDDVLSTGETLCAVLELLNMAGVKSQHIAGVMMVAEFPHHRGRTLLHERGFGAVKVQSLLKFGGP